MDSVNAVDSAGAALGFRAMPEWETLTAGERGVAEVAEQDPLAVATSTALDIARIAGTSEATVTRAARKLGFDGLKEFKQACAAAAGRDPGLGTSIRSLLDSLGDEAATLSGGETARAVLTDSARALLRFAESFPAEVFEEVVGLVESAPRTVLYGLGTAARVAGYLSLCLGRVGVGSLVLAGSGHALADDVHRLDSDDVVVVIAPRVLLNDVENLIDLALPRVRRVVLVSQVRPPRKRRDEVVFLELPGTTGSAATEAVGAWSLSDALVAELARRNPAAAIEARNAVQRLRDGLSPGRVHRDRRP